MGRFWVTLMLTLCFLQGLKGLSYYPDSRFYTEDAVVIDAVDEDLHHHRERRDIANATSDDTVVIEKHRQRQSEAFGLDCETMLGRTGTCRTFKECYPLFKVSDFIDFDSSIMGHYDSCSYISEDNTEVFGICCTEPVGTPPQQTPDELRKLHDYPLSDMMPWLLFRQIPAQWPPTIPPLPTHPPDHTAPTHPPMFGAGVTRPPMMPTKVTTTKKPLYGPTKPTTTRPIQSWPSPPTMKPVSTVKPPEEDVLPAYSGGCGIKNGNQYKSYQDQERIVGGHNADMNEWPWIVALFNGGRQFCGGSLISNKHVLSAAHCVAHMTSWDVARLIAKLGDHNIRTNTETRHIDKKIKRVVRHRSFDMRTLYNDIALLTIDSPVEFSKTIRPICLPMTNRAYSGNTATVIGWGSLREGGMQPSILQEVSIPIWSNTECRLKYGAAAPGGIVEHMVCAGRASMDSCSGDSGGPMMVMEGGKWTQVGVVSWGIGCGKGQYPGVYTRLTAFLPWIAKNTK